MVDEGGCGDTNEQCRRWRVNTRIISVIRRESVQVRAQLIKRIINKRIKTPGYFSIESHSYSSAEPGSAIGEKIDAIEIP